MSYIISSHPHSLDPLQFPFCCHRSMALHSSLDHPDNKDTSIGLLFIDYTSTFTTIIPNKQVSKHLRLVNPNCTGFSSSCPINDEDRDKTVSTVILNTGVRQRCAHIILVIHSMTMRPITALFTSWQLTHPELAGFQTMMRQSIGRIQRI